MSNCQYYINKLGLIKHPEGGAFKETYRSAIVFPEQSISELFLGDRNASTAIYFLLKQGEFSSFHKIKSDEIWHFYDGFTLTIYEIEQNGNLITHKLGRDLEKNESFQCCIQAGNWFASRCEIENGFSLVGCTVSPGFEFDDFELAEKAILMNQYPKHKDLIEELTNK